MASEGKQWLYYLLDDQGRSYYINDNGGLSISTMPRPLRLTPDGWQEISILWERNMERIGAVRNFTLPLSFVIDGAAILRKILWTTNVSSKVFVMIQKQQVELTPTTYHFWYRYFYRGEIDLATFNSEENKVTVNIMEGGLYKMIKANEATVYEIPCDEIFIRMDGIELFNTINYTTFDFKNESTSTAQFSVPIVLLSNDGMSPGILFTSQSFIAYEFPNNNWNWLMKNDSDLPVVLRLVGSFAVRIHAGAVPLGRIILQTGLEGSANPFEQSIDIVNQNFPIGADTPFVDFPFDFEVTLQPQEKLYIFGVNSYMELQERPFSIMLSNKHKQTNILAVKPYTLFYRLIEKITGDADYARSTLLNDNANLLCASGDAIRGFSGAVIKTSLNDFFTSFDTILNAGMGIIGNKIWFESKEFFFNPAEPIELAKAKDVKHRVAAELLASAIKIGYNNQVYEDVNGRQEFNTTRHFSTPQDRVIKTWEKISVYRADPYGIEYTRINFEGRTTTDTAGDNSVFVINTDIAAAPFDDGSYPLKRVAYDVIEGLLAPDSIFNIEQLTPARLMDRHRSWLNAIFYGYTGQKLKFESTDKNKALYTIKDSVEFDEDGDFLITDTPRLFKPFYFDVTPETPVNLVEDMEANPNRAFTFENWPHAVPLPTGTNILKGYNIKVGIAANSLEEQAFVLLSADENDLTLLQNG
jgi:hypothetical protein